MLPIDKANYFLYKVDAMDKKRRRTSDCNKTDKTYTHDVHMQHMELGSKGELLHPPSEGEHFLTLDKNTVETLTNRNFSLVTDNEGPATWHNTP